MSRAALSHPSALPLGQGCLGRARVQPPWCAEHCTAWGLQGWPRQCLSREASRLVDEVRTNAGQSIVMLCYKF